MIKRISIFCLIIALMLISCKKKEIVETKFNVNLSLSNNSSHLSWDAVTLSNFKNVSIYRSSSPISDPTFNKAIDAGLLVTTISDKAVTSFIDSTFSINNSGQVYYKLVMNFGDRFLVSELLLANFNGFSLVVYSGSSSSNYSLARLPEINRLYIYNTFGSLSSIDYSQKSVVASVFINANGGIRAMMHGNNPEVFALNGNTISCYDGLNLALKYAIPIGTSIQDYCIKNNRMYVLTNSYSIKTFDINTKLLLSERYLTLSGNVNTALISSGSLASAIYLYTYYQYYNSTSSSYVYKNELRSFSISTGLPVDSAYFSIPALNIDSFQQNNFGYQGDLMSPDGKYFACNQYGDIYSFYDNAVHNIHSSYNPTCLPSYSSDGTYMIGKPYNNGGSTVDVYALPGFSKITSVRSPGGFNNFNLTQNAFPDHDTLVSHSVTQIFQSNAVVATLTVFFNKIN